MKWLLLTLTLGATTGLLLAWLHTTGALVIAIIAVVVILAGLVAAVLRDAEHDESRAAAMRDVVGWEWTP